MRRLIPLFFLCVFWSSPISAHACPLVGDLIDYNCNQKHRVVFVGDSVVAGLGDTQNNGRGGYPKRLASLLPDSSIVNLGVSGYTTRQVLSGFQRGNFVSRSGGADILVIDAGRNDCRDNTSALASIRNLKRLVRLIRKKVGSNLESPPFVVIAMQIPNRDDRRSCIEKLNREMIRRRSPKFPVYLRFDRLSARILSGDGLHPDSAGYARMAQKALAFIQGKAQRLSARDRKDRDGDGVYDRFELRRYGTDTAAPDTDSDGLLDGEELFTHMTEPLAFDTDGGGASDGQEISDGTNPNDGSDDGMS